MYRISWTCLLTGKKVYHPEIYMCFHVCKNFVDSMKTFAELNGIRYEIETYTEGLMPRSPSK